MTPEIKTLIATLQKSQYYKPAAKNAGLRK
jgi:hypothetical protein